MCLTLNYKPKKMKDTKYLHWIKQQGCIECGTSPCDGHHLLHGSAKRNIDLAVVPLCREHHNQYHSQPNFRSTIQLIEMSYQLLKSYIDELRGKND